MSSSKQFTYRPKILSLESLAISRGIVESVAINHPLVERLRLRYIILSVSAKKNHNSSISVTLIFMSVYKTEVLMVQGFLIFKEDSVFWIKMVVEHYF